LLDAGNLFFNKSKSRCDQKELGKADKILKSYQSMAYDAINLGEKDLVLGISFLMEKASSLQLPFISSNLVSKKTGKPLFSPFIIKKAGQINVGIFGLMGHSPLTRKVDGVYIIKDPYATVPEMINSLKDKVDLIVALSSLSKEKNIKLLEDFLDIDFIISTDKRTHSPRRLKNGHTLSSGNKGKYLGRLDIRISILNRPLGLQDVSSKRRLKTNLTWLKYRIDKLENKRKEILKSENLSLKERFDREIERLKIQEDKYRKELASLDDVTNYFDHKMIPLVAKRPEKAPKKLSALHSKGKTKANGASPIMSPGPHIRINKLLADKGQKITLVLLIDKAPNQVRALGFDVVYDPKVLKYSKYIKGELVTKFDMFDASKLKNGQIRVGGFEARNDLIVAGKSGELVRLDFQPVGKGDMAVQLIGLKDDISAWSVEKIQ
jgi:hypothetical protein